MNVLTILCILLVYPFVHGSYYSRKVSYHNEAVVRCSKNINLERHMPVTFDVWKEDSISNDIKMKKTTAKALVEIFPEECSVIIPDLEKHVVLAEAEMIDDKQKVNPWQYWEVTSQDVDDPMSEDWFKKYHNYESIKTFYKTLAANNRELVTYVPSIGQSVEGRDMIALHITASKSPERLKYYIQCQIHAREWISGATCQYLAKKLVESYMTDHKVKNLLDQLEFVMVPVVNPDGYEYTWKQNRLWRKNRSYNEGSSCRGVDLNRNFEKGWGVEERSNTAPCSETYHGLRANSEPEVRNVVEYFKKHRPIAVGLDMHSYSELLLTPWGYERQDPIDETYLSNLGKKLAEMINKVHGSKYVTEKSIDLYRATGIAGDWFYSDDVIEGNNGYRPISITIELRDKGNYGFLLPKSEIIPTGEEIWPAIVELGEQILHKPLKFTSYEFYK